MIYTNLIGTTAVQINDLVIGIQFPNKITEFAKKILEEPENKNLIEKLISMEAGNSMKLKYIELGEKVNFQTNDKQNDISNSINDLDIPINIIDE